MSYFAPLAIVFVKQAGKLKLHSSPFSLPVEEDHQPSKRGSVAVSVNSWDMTLIRASTPGFPFGEAPDCPKQPQVLGGTPINANLYCWLLKRLWLCHPQKPPAEQKPLWVTSL